MDHVFKVFEGYGAGFSIYSNIGIINLIWTAIANQRFALFEKLLKVVITKNRISIPNAITVFSSIIVTCIYSIYDIPAHYLYFSSEILEYLS